MGLVIETDLGHDPDDFFAICYLAAAGVEIDAITLVPGDLDQVAIAKFLIKELDLDIPVGVSNPSSKKHSSGSIHTELLKRYGLSNTAKHDGEGSDILSSLLRPFDVFVIGPPTNIGKLLSKGRYIDRLVMQGGFLPYSKHRPQQVLAKFEGQESFQTFNMNGDIKSTQKIISSPFIRRRRFIGKNVCHTIVFDRPRLDSFGQPSNRAAELFIEGAEILFEKKREGKKFHDPVAACCFLHPEIGNWLRGVPDLAGGKKWTTTHSSGHNFVLADIDRDQLWSHLGSFT